MSIKHQNPRASSRVRKREGEAEAEQKEGEEGRRRGAWGGRGGEGREEQLFFLSLYTNTGVFGHINGYVSSSFFLRVVW